MAIILQGEKKNTIPPLPSLAPSLSRLTITTPTYPSERKKKEGKVLGIKYSMSRIGG